MSLYYKQITECDLCKSKDLTTYLDLGTSPLANSLKHTKDAYELTSPLKVVKCEECGCFQLNDLVEPFILFGDNYFYKSAKGLEKHFAEYAKTTEWELGLQKNDLIVGIGGNTGLLELEYKKLGYDNIVNVEPAKNVADESWQNGIYTVNTFWGKEIASLLKQVKGRKAHLITCNNCFAHTDLDPIIEGIKVLLDVNGFLVIENAYWLDTVKNSDIGQIYAEHYKYLSIKPLKRFFDLHGFDLFKVEYNKIQCGSFRAYIKWKANDSFNIDKSVMEAIKNEEEFGLYNKETYDNLFKKLDEAKYDLECFLNAIGKSKIGIYGVPAKLVLLLQYFGIKDRFEFATDDSDIKWQKFIPGTGIKILKPDDFWGHNFEYVLVGAYNFFDQIVQNNQNKKVKWIRLLPYLGIV